MDLELPPDAQMPTPGVTGTTRDMADDLIYGADKLAEFLFGDRKYRRRVYYLAESKKLPVLRLPGICARRSTLWRWIQSQELTL